jgi:Spx/MgsR family transcriptional regulator
LSRKRIQSLDRSLELAINGMMTAMKTHPTSSGVMASTVAVYGIPNCDTVKKARTWFTEQGVDYVFHDFKKQGVPTDLLPSWIATIGLDTLINRKGPTWRKLDAATQASVVDSASAIAVMQVHSSVIKRPVVVWRDCGVSVGFDPMVFAARARADSRPSR